EDKFALQNYPIRYRRDDPLEREDNSRDRSNAAHNAGLQVDADYTVLGTSDGRARNSNKHRGIDCSCDDVEVEEVYQQRNGQNGPASAQQAQDNANAYGGEVAK